MNRWAIYTSIVLVFLSSVCFGQTKKEIPRFNVFCLDCERSIVYAKESDRLPETIAVNGTVVDAIVPGTMCGPVAQAGSLKIRLDERVTDYPDEYLYVIVLCLTSEENNDLVGKRVDFVAKKMTKYPYSFSVLLTAIETHGRAFYLADREGDRVFPLRVRLKTK